MGKENDGLLPIRVERKTEARNDDEFIVDFGFDGQLGQIIALVPEGANQCVCIISLHRGPLLEDDVLDEDLIYEAQQYIQLLMQLPGQRAVTFNAGTPRPGG